MKTSVLLKIKELEVELLLITEARDNLKCCGNCKNSIAETAQCPHDNSDIPNGGSGYCSSWCFDGLTQKEREIEI